MHGACLFETASLAASVHHAFISRHTETWASFLLALGYDRMQSGIPSLQQCGSSICSMCSYDLFSVLQLFIAKRDMQVK